MVKKKLSLPSAAIVAIISIVVVVAVALILRTSSSGETECAEGFISVESEIGQAEPLVGEAKGKCPKWCCQAECKNEGKNCRIRDCYCCSPYVE